VCSSEGLQATPDALWEIARQADGALRDALSMLEQISGLGKAEITLDDVEVSLGQASRSSIERWLSGWRGDSANGDGLESFVELNRLLSGGASPQRFLEDLFSLVRNLWLTAKWKDALSALDASEQEKEYLKKEAPLWETSALESLMRFIAELIPQVRMGLRTDVLCGLLLTRAVNTQATDAPPVTGNIPMPVRIPAYVPAVTPLPSPALPLQPQNQPSQQPNQPTIPATVPAQTKQPEQEQIDASAWKPFPEEKWAEALRELSEKEFVMYCALLDAELFIDEGRGNALVLDINERYNYEVLKLDRHSLSLNNLKNTLTPDAPEVILRSGSRWTTCDAAAPQPKIEPVKTKKTSKGGKKAAVSEPNFEKFHPDFSLSPSSSSAAAPAQTPPRSGLGIDVPFAGLVQEAARWLGGELIMVRAGELGENGDSAENAGSGAGEDTAGEN